MGRIKLLQENEVKKTERKYVMPQGIASFTLRQGEKMCSGRYEVIKALGRGAFGFVLQARDTLTDEVVAIKVCLGTAYTDK
jgi:serine/threonine protein kinase